MARNVVCLQLNSLQALFSGAALFGTGFGPLVGGFIAQNTSWRWVFWVQVITNGVLLLVCLLISTTNSNKYLLMQNLFRP